MKSFLIKSSSTLEVFPLKNLLYVGSPGNLQKKFCDNGECWKNIVEGAIAQSVEQLTPNQ